MHSKIVSPNDEILILRYIYQELTAEEDNAFQVRLSEDNDFAERFFQLLNTVKFLEQAEEEPSEDIIDKILKFSESYPKE